MFPRIRFAVLLAGVTLAFSALAQPAPDDEQSSAPAADPPTRVARLSYLHGDVSFVPAGENDWVEAQLNRPLITGDKLWTDHGSRAELGIGPATLRIDQNTSFDFLNLDDKVAQVELTQGSLSLHIRRLYDEQSYEIDTPTLAFVVNRVGDFRIDVLPNGQATVVTVQQGGGDAYGEGGARFRVEEGQSVTFNDPQLQNYDVASIAHPDDFDSFAQERDHRWDSSASRRYVSEEVIGYEDLDDNGEWSDAPEYGSVWYPTTVAVGWSPYHHGHWGWVGAYGWTWIDDASWGFAPFHYGRWAFIGNRWGWCPGPVAVRAVYAPALVAFVGGGVSVGIGPVGWFPLGPRDVYFPSYRVSERYFVNLNFSNTRHVDRVVINNYYGGYSHGRVDFEHINYANRNVNGAVVAVSHEAFVGAHPVGREAIAVNHETFANGGRVSGFAAVAPTRTSLSATSNVARAAPPAGVMSRPIVAASKPPAPTASFAQRETQLQHNPGQPLTATQLHAPATTAATTAAGPNAGRQNVRVVTTTGVPARTAAPALPARTLGTTPNTGVPNTGANASATGHGAPNAVTTGRSTNVPAVQNNAAANVGTGGRPNANQHLDSSRFAHPQTGGAAATANNGVGAGVQNNGAGQPHAVTGAAQSVQHTNTPATNVQNNNRAISTERATGHTPAPNSTVNHPASQTPQTPQTLKPVASPYGAERSTGVGSNANSTHSGGNPQVQQYHAPAPQAQQYHTPAPQAQSYHAPTPQTQTPQAQQYHTPANTGQMQGHAPVSTGGQIQNQQIHQGTPPPPPAQHVQPPVNHAPPPQGGKDKGKDDDKKH